jgi:hypothetical protein
MSEHVTVPTETAATSVGLLNPIDKMIIHLVDPGKSSDNPHFKSRYLNLYTLNAYLKTECIKFGVSYNFTVKEGVLTLSVTDGKEVRTSGLALNENLNPQQLGSQATYFKRQLLGSFFGIVGSDEDDDGNSTSLPPQPVAKATYKKPSVKTKDFNPLTEILATKTVEEYLNARADLDTDALSEEQVNSLKAHLAKLRAKNN